MTFPEFLWAVDLTLCGLVIGAFILIPFLDH
jgi:hypothetical protein